MLKKFYYSIIMLFMAVTLIFTNVHITEAAVTKTQFAKEMKKVLRTTEAKTSETIYKSEIEIGVYKSFSKIEPTLKKYYTSAYIKKWKKVYNEVGSNLYVINEPFFPFLAHEASYIHLKNAKVNYDSTFRVKSLSKNKATVEFEVPPSFKELGDSLDSYFAQYKLVKKNGKWLIDSKTWKNQKTSKFKKPFSTKTAKKVILKQVNDIKNVEVKNIFFSKETSLYQVRLGVRGQLFGWWDAEVNPFTGELIEEIY